MRCFTLERGIDEESGLNGLRPINRPHFNFVNGFGAAHDLIEHFPKDGGRLEDELQAYGAILRVRGNNYNRHASMTESMAQDFVWVFPSHMDRPIVDFIRPREFHDEMSCLNDLQEEIQAAFDDEHMPVPSWCHPGEPVRRILGWIDLGFRRAETRYYEALRRGVDMRDYFEKVEDDLEWVIQHTDIGDRVNIKLCAEEFSFQWKRELEHEYDWR